jgi:hypothetical protein
VTDETSETRPSGLRSRGLLALGFAAASRQRQLLVPLVVAEALGQLLNLVPGLVLLGQVVGESWRHRGVEPSLALVLATIAVLTRHGTLPVLLVGTLLASFGAWLLRTFVAGAVVRALSAQLGRASSVDDEAFSSAIVEDPGRWLAAAGLAAVLRAVAFVCALGAVVAAMVFFTHVPGVAAALGMTFATALVVLLPVTDAALDLGFVRAVSTDEGPVTALGEGLLLAARRSRDLLPVWWLGVMLDLATAVAFGLLSSAGPVTGDVGLGVLLLGPRAMVFVVSAVAFSAIALVRFGAYAALVRDDRGDLPTTPAGPPPSPPPLPAEPVYEAVPIGPTNETLH